MPHVNGNVQGQVRWDFEQLDLVGGISACGRTR